MFEFQGFSIEYNSTLTSLKTYAGKTQSDCCMGTCCVSRVIFFRLLFVAVVFSLFLTAIHLVAQYNQRYPSPEIEAKHI